MIIPHVDDLMHNHVEEWASGGCPTNILEDALGIFVIMLVWEINSNNREMKFSADNGAAGSDSASRLLEAQTSFTGRCVPFIMTQNLENDRVQELVDTQLKIWDPGLSNV